jgi:membrane protein implicated in regulation of membrane protease activity
MAQWVWLAVIVLALIIEAMGPQLVSIWFAVGGVASFICELIGLNFTIQISVFVAVSVIALIATKPLVAKMKKADVNPTNADRYIGMEGKVTTAIRGIEGKGRVLVSGNSWSAVSDEDLDEGTLVKVLAIEGVKLRVKKLDK